MFLYRFAFIGLMLLEDLQKSATILKGSLVSVQQGLSWNLSGSSVYKNKMKDESDSRSTVTCVLTASKQT